MSIRLPLRTLSALTLMLVLHATPAYANRFGPPWQSRVIVDQAVLYTQPDSASQRRGALARGQIVVVTNEISEGDGAGWTQVAEGWLPSSGVAEDMTPWTAEVTAASVSVYARPNTLEPIRRTARRGDLLRVTGVSPGIEGDTNLWWATTEGYVGLAALQEATNEWAAQWRLPTADEAASGWWGAVRSQANVRAAPTTRAPIVGGLVAGDRVKVIGELEGDAVAGNRRWYRIDGGRFAGAVVHASLINRLPDLRPLTAARGEDAPPGLGTIIVSRTKATLTYVDPDGAATFTTYVSLGRAGVDTPEGKYETMGKYRFDNMSSSTVANPDHAYHLPNVPFVQYYLDGGFAIHSTYWHDHFGQVESQGCINLTWGDGALLFSLTQPVVLEGDLARWAINIPATPVLIVP